jgi:hypothetical protein
VRKIRKIKKVRIIGVVYIRDKVVELGSSVVKHSNLTLPPHIVNLYP